MSCFNSKCNVVFVHDFDAFSYANGGSTIFMKEQGMNVRTAKTGVKYVHHEAIKFDIGIYFEVRVHDVFIPWLN